MTLLTDMRRLTQTLVQDAPDFVSYHPWALSVLERADDHLHGQSSTLPRPDYAELRVLAARRALHKGEHP